jgi:signal transduction histidine kinase
VLEAAMDQAAADHSLLCIESTCNQVNQFGGYTGMTPAGFRDFVAQVAREARFDPARVIFGGDHLGPHVWRAEPATRAMAKARDLVRDCVVSGYTKIHLDASMRLGGDPGTSASPPDDTLVAQRTAELAAAEQSAKAKDQFVSQVSHELRTPLTSIRGYLALLLEDGADEMSTVERDKYLTVVARNADRLLLLVEDLLFVAQMDGGTFSLDEADLDLAELTAEAVEAAQPLADKRRITLRGPSQTKLPLLGDRARLAQVIDNLLSNALKFTSEGGQVTVDTARSNGNVRLVVADTGVGVRPDEIGHLFERFYRTDAANARAVQGSGLGLAISKAIVEAHGGTIAVASQLGVGTSLTIELPAA